jgi:hypothetical protein
MQGRHSVSRRSLSKGQRLTLLNSIMDQERKVTVVAMV